MSVDSTINHYPGSSSFFPGMTPFEIYDNDYHFSNDAPKVALWCARRLGYPIIDVELVDEHFYSVFEEAVSEYSAQVNQFNIRNNLPQVMGQATGSNYSQKLVEGSFLNQTIRLSDSYGTAAGVGGATDIKSGSIDIIGLEQDYDLKTLYADVSESGKRIEVTRVFFEPKPAISRFFDPYSISGMGTLNITQEFGFSSFSTATQFVLMPFYEDLLRIQAIEFNDQIRKSAHTFNITNGKLKIFPVPTTNQTLWFEYYVRDEYDTNSLGVKDGRVSDYSNIGYDFIPYQRINDVGRQWIRKYTLALCKELLGAIREKYSSIPIPGGETTLDGAQLRAEATSEKENLVTQLRENLDEVSRKKIFENKAAEANQQMEMLQKAPLAIFVG
jgi:hypothetical protein